MGVYLDATVAMGELAKQYMQWDSERLSELSQRAEVPDPREFNPYLSYTGEEDGQTISLHDTTVHELIRRNTVHGTNWTFLASMCLVSIYQFWEDVYRGRLADSLGVNKNELAHPVFGELRHLRRSIVHNKSRALPEVQRAKSLPAFQDGQPIALTYEMLRIVVREVEAAARQLAKGPHPESAP